MREGTFLLIDQKISLQREILNVKWNRLLEIDVMSAYIFRCVQSNYSINFTEKNLSYARYIARKQGDSRNENFFDQLLLEETGHHLWSTNDLRQIEKEIGINLNYTMYVTKPTILMMKNVSKSLESKDYISYLGYILLTELYPSRVEYWWNLSQLSGLSRKCFTEPINHARLDPDHAIMLLDHIASCFNSDQISRLTESASKYMSDLIGVYDEKNGSFIKILKIVKHSVSL